MRPKPSFAYPCGVLLGTMLILATAQTARAQTCGTSYSYSESYNTTTYEDPSSSVDGWGAGDIHLPDAVDVGGGTGTGDFGLDGMTVPYIAAGDFNASGGDDLLVLATDCANAHPGGGHTHGAGLTASGDPCSCQVVYGENTGSDWAFDLTTTVIDTFPECYEGTLFAGDFDGDGDKDAVYIDIDNPDTTGHVVACYVYENLDPANPGMPTFSGRNDCTALMQAAGVSWHWRSAAAQPLDWNKDGRDDLVVGSSYYRDVNEILLFPAKTTAPIGFDPPSVLVPNAGFITAFPDASHPAFGAASCPPRPTNRGISSVMAEDFDADGDYDVIAGSVSDNILLHWINDGTDNFYMHPVIRLPFGAPGYSAVADFDGDGDIDFAMGRNGMNLFEPGSNLTCLGAQGNGYLGFNDGTGEFTIDRSPVVNTGRDMDWLVALDINDDGMMDYLAGEERNPGFVFNIATPPPGTFFTPEATGLSLEIDSLDDASYGIVSVTITGVSATNYHPPSTDIVGYLSNDGGRTWELIASDELPPTSSPHNFRSYGAQLKWKLDLSAEVTPPATWATETPHVNSLAFDYVAVEKRRYTRSALAQGIVTISGTDHELLFSASYVYPGFEATVRAYDLSDLAAGTATANMERVDTHGDVSLFWDAGALLQSRAGSARTLYAAYPEGGTGAVDDRLDFAEGELTAPSSAPTLQAMMTVNDGEKIDVLRFVRDGLGATNGWKFYDVGHSSPVFVGAPSGDATYLGNNYATFQSAQSGRAPTVFIGANDGLVHAFDAATGAERWALVPYNLIAKLKTQRLLAANGVELYEHKYFVDGGLTLQDVYDTTTSSWKTILIGGQALGKGRLDNNYYFALNVTDPTNPLPMWEFSDPWDAAAPNCTTATVTESAECGVGSMQKCCEHKVDGVSQGEFFCASVASACGEPDTILGETWSPPVLARVRVSNNLKWVVFFGSGYNNRGIINVGRSVYVVDAVTGSLLGQWNLTELPFDASSNPSTIDNTIPGGLAALDLDRDGDVDRVYVGDLEGRLWKMDVSGNATIDGATGLINHNDWPMCVLFDAGDYDGNGTRNWAPVITQPAVAFVNADSYPNIYFGTGGDDRAPDSLLYRFYSVKDDDAPGTCRATPKNETHLAYDNREWVVGDGLTNEDPPAALSPADAEGVAGDRYWSDPVIVNNTSIYFASLNGDVESVNPCTLVDGTVSKVFGYAIQRFVDADGDVHMPGESLFSTDPYLTANSKIRQAVLVRGATESPWETRPQGQTATAKNDVFIQELTGSTAGEQPPIRRVTDEGMTPPSNKKLRILQWREIPLY